jgi:hypothetical protein
MLLVQENWGIGRSTSSSLRCGGMLSLLALVCLGLCLEELSICLLVGGRLEGRRVLEFGR